MGFLGSVVLSSPREILYRNRTMVFASPKKIVLVLAHNFTALSFELKQAWSRATFFCAFI